MKAKVFLFLFCIGIIIPSMQSCSKPKYHTRNGGKRIVSTGKVGYSKDRNRHVWGK